jgi:type VI secretion system protein ImpA
MSAQWDELLQPVSADRPCGEDLEYADLPALDALRLFGNFAPLASTPDWAEIRRSALDALGRTRDLRLLGYLGAAAVRTDGLEAFARTLTIASSWLNEYWTDLYPLVDEDAMLRRNALNCFGDPIAVIDGLRRLALVRSRQHGKFSLRDVEVAAGQLQPAEGESKAEEAHIAAAFAEMPLEELAGLQRTSASAVESLKRIEVTMSALGGSQVVPDKLEPLAAHFARLDRVFRAHLAARGEGVGAGEEPDTGGEQAVGGVAVGAITSRQDAVRALDAVAEYFRRNEPSSPIPLFVERAKRLVSKSFLEVLADVVPDAVGQARAAGGVPEQQ